MVFLVLITISVIWFFIIDKVIQQRFKTPKRGWNWYKHENKAFAILLYIILLAFILFPFMYPDVDLFLVFPFVGTLMNLIFSIEKFIYKKEEKIHINYLSDAIFWFILGVTAYIFIS